MSSKFETAALRWESAFLAWDVLKSYRPKLGRITKAGDTYLRTLLVLGARSMLLSANNKTDPVSRWAIALKERRGFARAVVAIAAKNARMCWAVLRLGERFKMPA